MNGQSGIGRLAQRLVVGLLRLGVNVSGARQLSVRDKVTGATLRVLVFPVTVDGVEHVVSTRPEARWVRSLRKIRFGELRLGSTRRDVRATLVDDDAAATRILQTYQRHVPALLSREPPTESRPVVFRLEPA